MVLSFIQRKNLTTAIVLFFLCLVPLAGQTQEELDNDFYRAIYAYSDNITNMRALLEKGANPNGLYVDKTYLMEMIERGDLKKAELLIEYGADLFARDRKGRNAAYYISENGMKNGAPDYLLSKGVRFDVIDNEGLSPCMYYMTQYNLERAVFVLDWEEKNCPRFTADLKSRKDYLTALFSQLCISSGDNDSIINMAFRLFNMGANTALVLNSNNGGTLFKKLMQDYDEINYVETLLRMGMSPNAKDSNGIPFAVQLPVYRDQFKVIAMLVEKGAAVNGVDEKGNTLLIRAANNSNNALVKFLLRHGANPNIQNKLGETALMKANSSFAMEAADALMANGANPNLQDAEGKTAVMYLISSNPDFALKDGVDLTIKDLEGRNALFYYITEQHPNESMLDYFIARGCNIEERDIDGYTPLTLAARYGREDSILILLNKGADPNVPGNGRYALHYYLQRLHIEINKDPFNFGKMIDAVIPAFLAAGANPALKDSEGESALSYVIYLAVKSPNMMTYRDQILKYADDDEIKTATAEAKKRLAKEKKENIVFSDFFHPAIWALGFSLLIGGLSIGMREKMFKGKNSENLMGSINAFLTMSATGVFLGCFIGLRIADYQNAGLGGLFHLFIGGILGIICGFILGILPPIRKAFKQNIVLYYIPTAIIVVTTAVLIAKIWL